MPIERERKFIVNLDQAHQLTDGLEPIHITQHYLSAETSPQELRIRQMVDMAKTAAHLTTLKQGGGARPANDNFIDDNGVVYFIDDNAVTFFTDDMGR